MLLCDLKIPLPPTPLLWCDNISAIAIASNPVFHPHTKHIEVDYHFVRERFPHKDLDVRYVATQYQIADIFTKPLHPRRIQSLRSKLMVVERPISLQGHIDSKQK